MTTENNPEGKPGCLKKLNLWDATEEDGSDLQDGWGHSDWTCCGLQDEFI